MSLKYEPPTVNPKPGHSTRVHGRRMSTRCTPETRKPKIESRNPTPETFSPPNPNSKLESRKLETRNPKPRNPETRHPKLKTRDPKTETRDLKPETRNPETQTPKPKTCDPKTETRKPRPDPESPIPRYPKPETPKPRNPTPETQNSRSENQDPKSETRNPLSPSLEGADRQEQERELGASSKRHTFHLKWFGLVNAVLALFRSNNRRPVLMTDALS